MDLVRAALHGEPRVHPAAGPIYLALSNGELLIEDKIDHTAGEKLTPEAAAQVLEVGNPLLAQVQPDVGLVLTWIKAPACAPDQR
jgi:hypothetical protein